MFSLISSGSGSDQWLARAYGRSSFAAGLKTAIARSFATLDRISGPARKAAGRRFNSAVCLRSFGFVWPARGGQPSRTRRPRPKDDPTDRRLICLCPTVPSGPPTIVPAAGSRWPFGRKGPLIGPGRRGCTCVARIIRRRLATSAPLRLFVRLTAKGQIAYN